MQELARQKNRPRVCPRRVVWQCNHKFKDKTRCKIPHLTEDEIKAAFVRMVNKLYADRDLPSRSSQP